METERSFETSLRNRVALSDHLLKVLSRFSSSVSTFSRGLNRVRVCGGPVTTMTVSGDDPAAVDTFPESIFNGAARGGPLVGWTRKEASTPLIIETADSDGRTGDDVFLPSVRDTSGADEIAELATGGK